MTEVDFADVETVVGKETGVSEWLEITQERVNQFADATGDHQWIHVDVERANKEIGGPIAHGFLTLSILPMLSPQCLKVRGVSRGVNYGSNKVRFTNMVPVGARVRLRQTCKSVEPKGDGKLITNEVVIEIEGKDRPALIAETLSLIYPA